MLPAGRVDGDALTTVRVERSPPWREARAGAWDRPPRRTTPLWSNVRASTGPVGSRVATGDRAAECRDLEVAFPWLGDATSPCRHAALRNSDQAFVAFLRGKRGPPRSTKKGVWWDAFRCSEASRITLITAGREGPRGRIQRPKTGVVSFVQHRTISGEVRCVHGSWEADRWPVRSRHPSPSPALPWVGIAVSCMRVPSPPAGVSRFPRSRQVNGKAFNAGKEISSGRGSTHRRARAASMRVHAFTSGSRGGVSMHCTTSVITSSAATPAAILSGSSGACRFRA